jgi:hypothetical protein
VDFYIKINAKIPDLWAPLGVCKVEFCDKSQNSLSKGLKPDKLLGGGVLFIGLVIVLTPDKFKCF